MGDWIGFILIIAWGVFYWPYFGALFYREKYVKYVIYKDGVILRRFIRPWEEENN